MRAHEHTGTRNNTTNFTAKPVKLAHRNQIKGMTIHNGRLEAETGKDLRENVDEKRTHLNDVLIGDKTMDLYYETIKRISGKDISKEDVEDLEFENIKFANGRKVRKDANVLECQSQYPGKMVHAKLDEYGKVQILPEGTEFSDADIDKGGDDVFSYPADMEEFNRWKELTMNYMAERFGGRENIIQAVCHMDESIPHIHAYIVPMYHDVKSNTDKLSLKHYLSGPRCFDELQTEYAAYMSELGYRRGTKSSPVKVTPQTATQFRNSAARVLSTVPDSPTAARQFVNELSDQELYEELRGAGVQLYIAKDKVKKTETALASSNRIITKQSDTIKKKDEEIKHLKEQIEEQKRELAKAQLQAQRRLCEKQGLQKCDDKEAVDVYLQFQEQLVEDGLEVLKLAGLDINLNGIDDRVENYIDKDNNGIDDRLEDNNN